MPAGLDVPLRLVLGDEELLVSRAVAEVVGAARAADAEADVRELAAVELTAGALYDLLSPSLFGGRRVVVVRGAHEAKADVGGKLAQLGGRLIDASAKRLAGEFFSKFGDVVGPVPEPAEAQAVEAASPEKPGVLRRWFGKKKGTEEDGSPST